MSTFWQCSSVLIISNVKLLLRNIQSWNIQYNILNVRDLFNNESKSFCFHEQHLVIAEENRLLQFVHHSLRFFQPDSIKAFHMLGFRILLQNQFLENWGYLKVGNSGTHYDIHHFLRWVCNYSIHVFLRLYNDVGPSLYFTIFFANWTELFDLSQITTYKIRTFFYKLNYNSGEIELRPFAWSLHLLSAYDEYAVNLQSCHRKINHLPKFPCLQCMAKPATGDNLPS